MRPVLLFVFVALLAGAGCKSKTMSTSAKEEFGKRYSCPDDRVAIKERSDLDPYKLLVRQGDEAPSDEVKKDPARLAKWTADKKAQDDKLSADYRRTYTIFQATGCEHDVLLACKNATVMRSGDVGGTVVSCDELK
ncbi:MAG: hypothetical protein KIT84_11915 [Labilithrix sp.]|nr:hypothetical protein [Labilithrix sp.]MCW5811717.1 hypothetical protein [Labilithrix sp.]